MELSNLRKQIDGYHQEGLPTSDTIARGYSLLCEIIGKLKLHHKVTPELA